MISTTNNVHPRAANQGSDVIRFERHFHLPVSVRSLDALQAHADDQGTTASSVVRSLIHSAVSCPLGALRGIPIERIPSRHRHLHIRVTARDGDRLDAIVAELETTTAALIRGLVHSHACLAVAIATQDPRK